MEFIAKCAASISKPNGTFVLLKFAPEPSHLIGEIAKELGQLEHGESYHVVIKKIMEK